MTIRSIQWENIDGNAIICRFFFDIKHPFEYFTSLYLYFDESFFGNGRLSPAYDLHRFGQLLLGYLNEGIEEWPRNAEVHIIVPRDESTMPYGSQHRTAQHIIRQLMASANGIEGLGYLQ